MTWLLLWLLASSTALAQDTGASEVPNEPATDVPAVDEPATDEPATDDTTTDEPATDEPATDDTTTDEPTTDEPATDEPATDEPTTDEPATDEPATDDTATDQPATDEPATDEPATDEPATDEPAADDTATDQPATDAPTTDEPAAGRAVEPRTAPAPHGAPPATREPLGWPLWLPQPEPAGQDEGPRVVQPVVSVDFLEQVLPWLPMRGFRSGLFLLFITLLAALGASVVGRLRRRLRSTGLLPRFFGGLQLLLRVVVVFTGLGVIAAFIPHSIAPALPLVVLAVAVAVGWSARDFLPDLVAGVLLALEQRIRRGRWIQGKGFSGVVESTGLRATWVRDAMGRQVAIPNRLLLGEPVTTDLDRWPAVEVLVEVPGGRPTSEVRALLREAVLLCPWLAPGQEPVLVREADRRWRVRARLLEGQHADRFEGALRERVADQLGTVPDIDEASESL